MLRITDAYMGKTHVTSEDVGFYNIGQFGYETGYFELKDINSSEEFETEILSGNKVRIKQGMGIVGGRRFRNDGFLDITLDSGATGENRIDAIVLVRSQDAEGIESIKTEIWRRQYGVGHVLQPNGRSSGPAHQGPYRRAPDARHRAHDSRWQPLLHDALCLLGRYAQCQALFPLHHPRYLRYGHRFCCGECPAQDAGRKAYPRHSRRLISGLSCGELR